MKKINLILIILILFLGGFVVFNQLSKDDSNQVDDAPLTTDDNYTQERQVGLSEPLPAEETKLTEVELFKHIKSKRYLENTYMALEYSKVNNKQLLDTLKTYTTDETTMKPEDAAKLIEIHEKTFLNRYLKVFVSTPDEELLELNNEMRRLFFQMKTGFDTLHAYGSVPLTSMTPEEAVKAVGEDAEGEVSSAVESGATGTSGEQGDGTTTNVDINNIPITQSTKPAEPVYDINVIIQGIKQLEEAEALVSSALKKLGIADIVIEQQWLRAGISESDLTQIMDKTNIVNPELSESDSFGTEEETTREDSLSEETLSEETFSED